MQEIFQQHFLSLTILSAMTAADKYFLIAKENYPYEINDALDALEYGLSYDDTHAALLTLRGEIQYKDLHQYAAAADSFGLALYHDPAYVETYYLYIALLCTTGDIPAAERLIARALKVTGIDKGRIWHSEAQLYEQQGIYTLAQDSLRNALMWCSTDEDSDLYTKERKRIKKKMKLLKTTDPEPSTEQQESLTA
jgi:tetratricopeptide (TPR) repeat protein